MFLFQIEIGSSKSLCKINVDIYNLKLKLCSDYKDNYSKMDFLFWELDSTHRFFVRLLGNFFLTKADWWR